MSTKKRTKKYAGPKYIAKNPMVTFFGGMSDQHAQHLQTTLLANHTAMANMARGVGDAHDWDRLNGAINMALVMTEQGIGAEYRDEFKAASQAMLACVRRALKTDRYVFTGDELKAMNTALDSHDAQMTCIRAIDVDRAAAEVMRRLQHRVNVASIHETHPEEVAA